MPKTLLSHKEDLISPEEKELFYKGVREEFDHKLQEGSLDFSEMYQFVCDISFEQTDYNEKYSELGYFIDTNDLAHELIIKWMKLETNSITTEEFLFLLNESGNPHTYLGYLGSRLGEQFDKVFEAWCRGEDKASPEMLMFARVFGVDKLNEDKFKSRVTESMKVSFDDAVNFINKYLSSESSVDFLPNTLVISHFFQSDNFSFEEKLRLAQEFRKTLLPDEESLGLLQSPDKIFERHQQEQKFQVASQTFYDSWEKEIEDKNVSFEECKRICQDLNGFAGIPLLWLQRNKKSVSLDQFQEILEDPKIKALSTYNRRHLLHYYLKNKFSQKSLHSLLPLKGVIDDNDIFFAFIELDKNPNYKRKVVKEAFALGFMTVEKFYSEQATTHLTNSIEYIYDYICSNDEQRKRFLDHYIDLILEMRGGADENYFISENENGERDFLKKLISSFEYDINARYAVEKVTERKLLLGTESLSYICEDRAKRKYPSLFKILEGSTRQENIAGNIVDNAFSTKRFDDIVWDIIDSACSKDMDLFRLFGYLEIFIGNFEEALEIFSTILSLDDYEKRIREKISSSQVSLISDERSYISREEANAIAVACGQVLILPRLFELANYLSICIDIKPYNPQSVRINFKDSANSRESTEDAESAEDLINKKFVGLLSQDPSGKSEEELDALSDEVVAFFSQLLQQPDLAKLLNAQDEQEQEAQAALPEDDRLPVVLTKTKIRDLFFTNKREFVEIFSREGGIELFKNYVFPTLDHGCVYNIHNQMLLAIYQSLIEDPAQKVLMVNFAKKIFQDINSLNNGFLEHANPLEGHSVASGFFSLLGLRKEIAERFKSGDFSASNFLVEHHLTKEERQDLRELRKYEKPVHDGENAPSFFDLEPKGSPKKMQLQEIMQKERKINELYDEVFEQGLSDDISVEKRFGIVEERKISLASAMVMDDFVRQNWEELKGDLEGSLEYRDLERFITFYMKYREAFVEAFMGNSQESLQAMASPISSFQAAAPTKIPTSEQVSQLSESSHAGQKDNLEIG